MLKANGVMGLSPAISRAILDKVVANPRQKTLYFSFSFDQGVFTLGGAYDLERFAAKPADTTT
jgi:hypothetical protein